MRKHNLNKSKGGSARDAAGRQRKRSTRLKKADSARGTSSNESAVLPISGRNSKKINLGGGLPELNELFEQGIQLRLSGRFQEAVQVLEAAVRRFPGHAPAFWYLGGIYLHDLNEATKALSHYKKAVGLSPRSERASLGVFHSLWKLGRRREAMKELGRFLEVAHSPDYVQILAEVRNKHPELLTKTLRTKAS
jgi:tetratricopeptide (TPR) repeat protein